METVNNLLQPRAQLAWRGLSTSEQLHSATLLLDTVETGAFMLADNLLKTDIVQETTDNIREYSLCFYRPTTTTAASRLPLQISAGPCRVRRAVEVPSSEALNLRLILPSCHSECCRSGCCRAPASCRLMNAFFFFSPFCSLCQICGTLESVTMWDS